MPEPILPIVETPSPEAELATLRKANQELIQKGATRKARILELEASVGTLTTRATESDAHIKALTIDGPLNDVCESISVAPAALRTAFEADYKVEAKDGVLTIVNASDGKPVTDKDGKAVPLQAQAIKTLLLSCKDEAKLKLYRAIVVVSHASGAGGSTLRRAASAPAKNPQFGLGMSVKN